MDKEIEQEIQDKGLTAPRVTPDSIEDRIATVEYITFETSSKNMLRWCVITMVNGFSVTGNPTAAVSIENDDPEIGEKIAYANAYNNIWALEGYLLKEKLKG